MYACMYVGMYVCMYRIHNNSVYIIGSPFLKINDKLGGL